VKSLASSQARQDVIAAVKKAKNLPGLAEVGVRLEVTVYDRKSISPSFLDWNDQFRMYHFEAFIAWN
jgi:hypothetical protein